MMDDKLANLYYQFTTEIGSINLTIPLNMKSYEIDVLHEWFELILRQARRRAERGIE